MSPIRHPAALFERPNPFAALFAELGYLAATALRRSEHVELHGLTCEFSGGVLVLRGFVPSDRLRQLAEAVVAETPGVLEIENQVEVVRPALSPSLAQQSCDVFVATPGD